MLDEIKYRLLVFLTVFLQKMRQARVRVVGRRGLTEQHWDNGMLWYAPAGYKTYWETLETVGRYQHECITGDTDKDYITYTHEYVQEHVGTQNLRGLSIGCGEEASPEMVFYETGHFIQFDVMDVSQGLLKRQEQAAQARGLYGIKYTQQDLNQINLERDAYDLIWALGTVHHIEHLEHFFGQVRHGLKDRGIFVMREYVGPNQLQFSDEQLALVNDTLSSIPVRYRMTWYGLPKRVEKRVKISKLMKADPSEAVRSEDILSVMNSELEIVRFADTGGTLLHPLLNGIAANFERDEQGDAILRDLITRERSLIEGGVLPSDYMFCIARKGTSA